MRTQSSGVAAAAGRFWFPVLWSFIGFVSAVDSYFVVRFRDMILQLEENPIGWYLIALNDGNVGLFLRTKAAGTLLVLSVLLVLYRYRRCWAFPVTGTVAAFQCLLLVYLLSGLPAANTVFGAVPVTEFCNTLGLQQPYKCH